MLAGDNALVIALAVRTLPREQQWRGRLWGAGGAVALRLLFITAATYLLKVPFLQLAGGVLLVGVAVKLTGEPPEGADGEGPGVCSGATLWQAVWIITVADVVMSLDNVLAIAAIGRDHLGLVAFGIGLSLPLVVFGSAFLALLMERFASLVWLGAGILGYFAGGLIFDDAFVGRALGDLAQPLDTPVATGLAAGLTGLGWRRSRRPRGAAQGGDL